MTDETDHNEHKYLAFRVGDETYGIEVLRVREIMSDQASSPLPKTAEFVRGVINLRGAIVPVISLRHKFAMPPIEPTDQTCIVVVEQVSAGRSEPEQVGLVVDRVCEVIDIGPDRVQPPPNVPGADSGLIQGIGMVGQTVVLLLDVERVVEAEQPEPPMAVDGARPSSPPEPSQTEAA